jgi:galactokinase
MASEQMLEGAGLTDIDQRRARHVIQENARVEAASRALADGDLKRFGSLLLEGHESLKSLFEVTTPELDLVVEVAANAPDDAVYGARMTGGGFGGSVIVLARPEKIDLVRRRINDAFRTMFNRSPQHFTVSAVDGAGVWR